MGLLLILSISTASPHLLISRLLGHSQQVLTQTRLEDFQELRDYMHREGPTSDVLVNTL